MFRKTASAQVRVLDAWQVAASAPGRSLRKLAHRVDFEYTPRKGYLYFRSRAISSRTNDNHDTFPAAEIEAAYQSFLGKPLFVNHHNSNHRRARGVIIAAALHKDRNPDGSPDTWVELLHELDASLFPKLAKAILAGRVNRTSMGVDVDWSECSACGNKATNPAEYCEHLPGKKGLKIRKRAPDGKLREEIIHEICHKLAFFENSVLVEDPADPTAYVTGKPDARGLQMAASKKTAGPTGPHPGRLQGGTCREACTYGGTHCLVCHEPAAINLHKTNINGGWHHADSMKRDHPAVPADGDAVIASIPAQLARKDQIRSQVRDQFQRQLESLGPVPPRKRGDEGQMPLDPFLSHFRQTALDLPAPDGSDFIQRFESPLGSPDSDTGFMKKYAVRTPHQGAISIAQRRTRWDHPKLGMELPEPEYGHESADAGATLEHMLTSNGYPADEARGAFVVRHRDPHAGTSNTAYDNAGHPGAALHPARWDYGTLAHEAAHHLTLHQNAQGYNDPTLGDADIHGDKFAHNYAKTLGMVSKGAGEDFLRHRDDAMQLIGSYRYWVHGLPRQLDKPRMEFDAAVSSAQQKREQRLGARYENPGDHPFFQANPVSIDNLLRAWADTTPEERQAGARWYSDAHHVAKAIAGGDAARGAGLLSAYSPRTSWPLNLFHASRAHVEGRAPGPGEGPILGMHQRAAQRILDGEHHSQVFTQPKTQDFAHLVEHGGQAPGTPEGRERVVIDRHALSAAVGRRLTDKELSAAPIKRRPAYEHVAELYRGGARVAGVSTEEFQAGLWGRQQRVNNAEDTGVREGLRKARQTLDRNAWSQWGEHSRQHGIPLDAENLHMHASRRTAAGQEDITVPGPVDTLRQENCPVCGDSEVYTGQRCPVCGYVSPPSLFRDPDIERTREVRDQLEQSKEQLGLPQGPADEEQMQQGSFPDADDQLAHPDQIAPDGTPAPIAGQPGAPMPGGDPADPDEDETELLSPDELGGPQDGEEAQEADAEPGEPGDEDEEAQGAILACPACGTQFAEGQDGAAAGQPCPACGQAPLQPADDLDDEEAGKDQDTGRTASAMPKDNARTAAAQAQRAQFEQVLAENRQLRRFCASLQHQLNFMGQLAGCEGELNSIRRQADMMNPGSPVPDPPEQPAPESTEQALQPAAQGDVSRPGTEPGSVTHVPAAQTTTAITPGVEMQTPPATNLIDVTAPITGTNPSQDGGVPLEQRRIETDVRINPDPLQAGPTQGVGGQPSPNGTAFPWILPTGPGQAQQQKAASAAPGEEESSRRTFAAIRLARLRVAHGMARGDELDVAAAIEREASLPTPVIEHEINVLAAVRLPELQRSRGRMPARTAARSGPSLSAPSAPMLAMTGSAVPGYEDNGEDIFTDF